MKKRITRPCSIRELPPSPRTREGTRGNSLSGRPSFQKTKGNSVSSYYVSKRKGEEKKFSHKVGPNFFFCFFVQSRRSRSGVYPTKGSNDRFNFGTLLRFFFFCIFHHDACARWGTGGRERTRRLSLERNPNKFSVALQTASG